MAPSLREPWARLKPGRHLDEPDTPAAGGGYQLRQRADRLGEREGRGGLRDADRGGARIPARRDREAADDAVVDVRLEEGGDHAGAGRIACLGDSLGRGDNERCVRRIRAVVSFGSWKAVALRSVLPASQAGVAAVP